jgi:hypothetical protein
MKRLIVCLLLVAGAASAVDRLYLKDGTYQIMREYEVQSDRIRYYSSERGEWEEIPKELVDLERTKKENAEKQAAIAADAKAQSEEDAAIRAAQKEIERVPQEPGAYWVNGDKIEPMKAADVKIVNDKKRSVLKVLSPVPLVPGKNTVELDGEKAIMRLTETRPEFYFRLVNMDSVALIKLTPKKNIRLVENVSIQPVVDEKVEERQAIPSFRKQVDDYLFKIWPENPLEPGEYALLEYVEGQVMIQVWDFAIATGK